MITAAQCRTARALLDWSQEDLAFSANVGIATVRQFEREKVKPRYATQDIIRRAFETGGVEFLNENNGSGAGLRFRKGTTSHSK
ncbi:MAG: helix-turn-helix domain-containing protein [Xanthobacteraceae bacterium]